MHGHPCNKAEWPCPISIDHQNILSNSWFVIIKRIKAKFKNFPGLTITTDHYNICIVLIHCICILIPCPSIGPKWFWNVQIVLDVYKLFWSGPNHFGRVQIILVRFKLYFSGLIFIIRICPKWFGPDQNKLVPSKMIATRPKWFWQSKIILYP